MPYIKVDVMLIGDNLESWHAGVNNSKRYFIGHQSH